MTNQEIIQEVLEEFDFEKVRQYMEAVNWTWYQTSRGRDTVPAIFDMKETAEELLNDVFNGAPSCSTGGFIAYQCGEDYALAFSIEEHCTHISGI